VSNKTAADSSTAYTTTVELSNVNNNNDDSKKDKPKERKRVEKIRNCTDLFWWFKRDPMGRWPIVLFICAFIGSITTIGMYVLNRETGGGRPYIILAVIGIITSILGYNHFRLLMQLIAGVDDFQKLNIKFAAENKELTLEVNRLKVTVNELKSTRAKITGNVTILQDNINKLDNINDNLERFNIKNIKEITNVMNKAKTMSKKWREELIKNERNMLHSIFDKYEFLDKSAGMDIKEYKLFLRRLPERYMAKIVKIDFFKLYGTDDGVIDFVEFGMALDILAEIEMKGLPLESFNDMFYNQKQITMRANNANIKPI